MLTELEVPPIVIDRETLRATESREPFDRLGYEMLARSGRMAEQVVASVQRATPSSGLTLDESVVGGLLVRTVKLTRGIFDATQAEESEAHLVLSRCAAETAVTLRWLVCHRTAGTFRRFRADSFAYWRKTIERMNSAAEIEDGSSGGTRKGVKNHVAGELRAAEVRWEDVPSAPNRWGPNMRQRCEALDQGWVYDALFASHSSYVHPSWHELRAFHLASEAGRMRLDATYGGMAPISAYVVARLFAEACSAAAGFLSCDLAPADVEKRVRNTTEASQILALEFYDFTARGGLDEDLRRHAAG
jgi:hypothetical protein